MEFSHLQQAVFKWVREHRVSPGALIVEAVAGSGKTTTIVEAATIIPERNKAVFLAFNKKIADELGAKLPAHVESKTLNGLGWALCRWRLGKEIKVERNKTRDLIRRHVGDQADEILAELMNIIGKAKSHGLIPPGYETPNGTYEATQDRWVTLMDRYDIDPGKFSVEQFVLWANRVLAEGLEQTQLMDFDDQLYMPVALDLPAWKYDWLIIDEAQDVSHVQRTLLQKFAKPSGKFIAVGDTHQAIYGFRGADSQSMENIRSVFNCDELPLDICYRCPRKVIEIAQEYVPHIQASENAPEGEVLHPTAWNLHDFNDSDMVVCRNTAPLIELAFKCIAEGKAVHVMGREIGKGLINVVRKVAGKKVTDLDTLRAKLDIWAEKQYAKAVDDEQKQAAIGDRVECLRIMMAGLTTVAQLIAAIERIFSDKQTGTVLATVHKAKGLEAPRVFILEPDLMPSPWAKKAWQQQQEKNLCYVAVTRALETLVYLPLELVGS